ncbi:MAG TPA: type II and III secretion system protein, partial [Balneolales bacterium]|nr:type II and III secretion system protein [Balneolales bacterium]
GKVNIESRPEISTLNGHTASIQIGTTQYFILKTTTPIQSPQNVITQESQHFETIKANVSLKITPWVSSSGEVTAEIHPEFDTPVGAFNPNVPPTINSRVLDSTVRLKDGETIILGGLIQNSDTKNYNKIPILGDIPLIGKLFSNRSRNHSKSELIIFITPHVFFGDGTDAARWQKLSNDMDLHPDIKQ